MVLKTLFQRLGFVAFLYFHAANGESEDYEFGRKASVSSERKPEEEVDIFLRDLAELGDLSMSMSFSMSMYLSMSMPMTSGGGGGGSIVRAVDGGPAVPLPGDGVTSAPTSPLILNEVVNPCPGPDCNEPVQSIISIPLEVETAAGTDTFAKEVAASLNSALSETYETCEVFERKRRHRRRLQDSTSTLCMRGITVVDESSTCTIVSELASMCHHARAEIIVATTKDTLVAEPMQSSVQLIVDDHEGFDEELLAEGIVDVRIRSDIDLTRSTGGSGDDSPRSPVTAAVVSVAAGGAIVLAALAFRRSKRKEVPVAGQDDGDAPDAENNADAEPDSATG